MYGLSDIDWRCHVSTDCTASYRPSRPPFLELLSVETGLVARLVHDSLGPSAATRHRLARVRGIRHTRTPKPRSRRSPVARIEVVLRYDLLVHTDAATESDIARSDRVNRSLPARCIARRPVGHISERQEVAAGGKEGPRPHHSQSREGCSFASKARTEGRGALWAGMKHRTVSEIIADDLD